MNKVLLASTVAIVVVLISTGSYILLTQSRPSHITSSSSSQQSISTISCSVPDTSGDVFLRISSDTSNQSLSGVNLTVTERATFCPVNSTLTSFHAISNSTGWVLLGNGLPSDYYFRVSILDYIGKNYSIIVPQGPGETTLASISLPSGIFSIQLCVPSIVPSGLSCQPYVDETNTITPTISTSISP